MKKYIKVNKSIWLIIIGILLLTLDFRIPMGEAYPPMEKALDFGTVFQTKVIDNLIGTQPTVDILSDLLGYIFLLVGSIMMVKYSKKFLLAIFAIPVAVYLYIIIPQLPYYLVLEDLYLKMAGYHFLIVFIQILIEYLVIYGVATYTQCMQNKWHSNEMLAGWIVAMMSKAVLIMIRFFFGQHVFYHIYYAILIGATIFYINRMLKALEYKKED